MISLFFYSFGSELQFLVVELRSRYRFHCLLQADHFGLLHHVSGRQSEDLCRFYHWELPLATRMQIKVYWHVTVESCQGFPIKKRVIF